MSEQDLPVPEGEEPAEDVAPGEIDADDEGDAPDQPDTYEGDDEGDAGIPEEARP